MKPEDLKDLREMQSELLAVESSFWQPRCVSRTFWSCEEPFVFTMQAWIDLDAIQSPFLLGELPPPEEAIWHFQEAFAAFGHWQTTPDACDPEELILLGRKMIAAISEGFSMRVKLSPPEGRQSAAGENGLGDWLPIMACLKSQLMFSLAEIEALPVGKAFALLAAHRCNEGWSVSSETYAMRDIPEEEG